MGMGMGRCRFLQCDRSLPYPTTCFSLGWACVPLSYNPTPRIAVVLELSAASQHAYSQGHKNSE